MASGPDLLVDTSVAVALVVVDHAAHEVTTVGVGSRSLGLAGHAWFETYSVLTRLPGSARRDPSVVTELLTTNFPGSRFLDEAAAAEVGARLADKGVAGGAVYDALVAAVSLHHRLPLASRDRRALGTYAAFGVDVELIE